MSALVAEGKETTGFGGRLRALRLERGLTQEAFAARAGMRYQMIAKLERGANEPTWRTVLKLAEALEVPVTAFVNDE